LRIQKRSHSPNPVKLVFKDSCTGVLEKQVRSEFVEVVLNKMEVEFEQPIQAEEELEIKDMPEQDDAAPRQTNETEEGSSGSDSDDTVSTISSPSNYFSGPASSVLLAQSKVSPPRQTSLPRLPASTLSPLHQSLSGLKMVDSGYYDTTTSKSEPDIAMRRSPLSMEELKSSPAKSTSLVYSVREMAVQNEVEKSDDEISIPSHEIHSEDVYMLLSALQSKCSAQEEEIESLRSERIKETVAAQMGLLNSLVTQQEELQTTVHQLTRDLAMKNNAIVHLEGKVSFLESQSPRSKPPMHSNDASPNVRYHSERWAVHRTEPRKDSEEMRMICESLESEGYGPSHVSADEVIRNLWWQKEHLRKNGGVSESVSATGVNGKDLSEQFSEYQEKLTTLKEELSSRKEDLQLKKDIASETESVLKRQIEEILTCKQEVEGKLSTLKGKMAAFEQDNVLLREKSNQLRLELLESSTRAAKQTRDLAGLRREKFSILNELGVLRADKNKAATDMTTLRGKMEEMEYDMEKLKKENCNLQQELQHIKQNLTATTNALDTSSSEATESRILCDDLKGKIDNLEEERSRREKWMKELQDDANSLRAQLREKEEASMALFEKEQTLSLDLELKNKKLSKLQNDLRVVEEQVAVKQRELNSKVTELREKEHKVHELTRGNSILADEIAELKLKLDHLSQHKSQVEREAQDVNDELSQMKTKVLELEQKLTDKTDEFDKLLRRSESLSGKLNMLKDEKVSLSQQLTKETKSSSTAKKEYHLLEKELEKCRDEHRKEIESQMTQYNQLMLNLSEAEETCELVTGENQELQKQVEELEHSLAESDTKLQKSEEEYVRVTEALQHQLNVVTEEYNRYQMASEKLKGGLTRKNDELEAKVLALGGELRERDSTINAMSSESSGLQSRIMALSGEIDELARNKSELENRLRKERSSVDASVRRAEEQVEIQKQHMVNLKEELAVANAASHNLQLKLDQMTEENQSLVSRLRDSEDKILVAEGEKEEVDTHWRKMSKELQEERQNHKESIVQLEETLEEIRQRQKREMEIFEEEKTTLKQQSKSLREELSQSQHKLTGVQRDLERVRSELQQERVRQEEATKRHHKEARRTQEEREEMKREIKQKTMSLTLAEDKIKQLDVSLHTEVQAMEQLQEEIQHVHHSKTQLKLELETEKEKVFALTKLKDQLEGSTQRESVRTTQLTQEVGEIEEKLRQLERQLQEEREASEVDRRKQTKEYHDSRSKYHEEKKALKSKIKQLNKEYDRLRLQCQQLKTSVASLESSHSILSSEKLQLTEELAKRDELALRLREETRRLELRNSEYEFQVTRLKEEVYELQRVHLEFEEYKKRLDSASKAEMQRILSEVTRHMEQQYVAHRNLDKLRLENEGLSLRQKDRKIDKLKSDLKRSQLNERQDRLHLETLELEAEMLRSQKKELDRSRRKLESRLEKVNNSLSQSIQEAAARNDTLSSHMTTSTPASNPPSRQRSLLSDSLTSQTA
jgi:chromosome segregation ATPase